MVSVLYATYFPVTSLPFKSMLNHGFSLVLFLTYIITSAMLIIRPSRMNTILPCFSENMADISKKLAEFEDAMQAKLKEEIAIQTSFMNFYILEKAKTSSRTIECVKYRQQVASIREEISKFNEHLVLEIAGTCMKRAILISEKRDKYEEKMVIERAAFTTA